MTGSASLNSYMVPKHYIGKLWIQTSCEPWKVRAVLGYSCSRNAMTKPGYKTSERSFLQIADKMKWEFLQAVATLVLLYNWYIWKLDENYTKMLHIVFNKT